MNRNILVGIAAGLVLVVGVPWLWIHILANRDAADLKEQLRLARTEGLPTNAAEFAATIKPASPAENAAPFYRDLIPLLKPVGNFSDLEIALLRDPSPQNYVSAQAFLRRGKPALDRLDQATARPRCWFNRNWSDWAAVSMPEFASMKAGARLLGLRGSVAATNGNESAALANARKIFVLSKHAGEEGGQISALVSLAVYVVGLNRIADWAFLHPQSLAYRNALADAIGTIPRPNGRRENRDQLINIMSIIDLTLTKAGREKLGLKDDDFPRGPNLLAYFRSQPKARITIVKAERDYWAALELPPIQRAPAISNAAMRRNNALLAFPLAAKLYDQLFSFQDGADEDEIGAHESTVEMDRLEYTAVLRALSSGTVAHTIATADLKSPRDGMTLKYSFDGKQMVIEVSGPSPSATWHLEIPPNAPKH